MHRSKLRILHCVRRAIVQQRSQNVASELKGWGGRIRTSEWRLQRPLPYRLATPQCVGRYFSISSRNRQTGAQDLCSRGNKGEKNKDSPGDDLLSQGAAPPVPSALADLTSGFGMEPGVTPPLESPREFL
jgi:hypothetical protein